MQANGPAIKCRLCWFEHGGCEQKCRIGVKSCRRPWPKRSKRQGRQPWPSLRAPWCRAAPRASKASDGGTICLGARNLSRYRNSIADRRACRGATGITNLSWVPEQEQKPWRAY